MCFIKKLFLLVLFPLALFAEENLLDHIEYSPPKEWVLPIGFSEEPNEGDYQGIIYLLADKQYHQLEKEIYFHEVKKILSVACLASEAKFEVVFIPNCERVSLHQILIYRNGEVIDQLQKCPKKVLDEGFSNHGLIYEEHKRLVCILEDLREGDVVEYAFTIKSDPPFFQGHAQTNFPLVERVYAKTIFSRLVGNEDVKMKVHKIDLEPAVVDLEGGLRAWSWVREAVEPIHSEKDAPVWFDNVPWIQVSDWESWEFIGRTYAPAFSFRGEHFEELMHLVKGWKEEYEREEDLLLAALDFVQSSVRYLSFHEGESSWMPHSPNDVIARRYGDCKDKTALFLSILDLLEIESFPILVHSFMQQTLGDLLPCNCFNHVIVGLFLKEELFFIDPIRAFQTGDFKQRSLSPYKVGLPLSASCKGLISIPCCPFDSSNKRSIIYRINPQQQTAVVQLKKVVSGYGAEEFRRFLKTYSMKEISEIYESYLQMIYNNVNNLCEINFVDDADRNVIEFCIEYKIQDFGEYDEGSFSFEIEPLFIQRFLQPNLNAHRKSPLAQYFPNALEEEILIYLENGEIIDQMKEVSFSNPSFEASIGKEPMDHGIVIHSKFLALKDSIELSDLALVKKHFKALNEQAKVSFQVVCE